MSRIFQWELSIAGHYNGAPEKAESRIKVPVLNLDVTMQMW